MELSAEFEHIEINSNLQTTPSVDRIVNCKQILVCTLYYNLSMYTVQQVKMKAPSTDLQESVV